MNIIDTIIRDVCETDRADPCSRDTVCIDVEDLRVIIANNLAPTQGADARPVAMTEAMAEEMGATGSPHSEPERLLFEAYCKGHCWEVGQWTGTEYYEMLDRIRFATWRDRAALATRDAAPIPSDCDVRKILLMVVPGDGSGLEVYAENVLQVESLLSEMGERLETYEATRDAALTLGYRIDGADYTDDPLFTEEKDIADDYASKGFVITKLIAAIAPREEKS